MGTPLRPAPPRRFATAVEMALTLLLLPLVSVGIFEPSRVTVRHPFSLIAARPVARLVVTGGGLDSPIVMAASAMTRNE